MEYTESSYKEHCNELTTVWFRLLSSREKGLYFSMKLAYWACSGCLPANIKDLSSILNVNCNEIIESLDAIMETNIFYEKDGFLIHQELEQCLNNKKASTDKRLESRGLIRKQDRKRLNSDDWLIIKKRIFERDNYTCLYCSVRGVRLECDLIIPIAKGGSNEELNLATACVLCNREKRDSLIEDWLKKNKRLKVMPIFKFNNKYTCPDDTPFEL